MTRRNDKRNNRRNSRQRNNTPELPPFAQMLFGAIVGKGVDMIAKKMAENAEQETPDIHAEGISNQDVTNINNGKATLSKLRIPADGSAVEYPIPDNLQFFFAEDGKLMVRQKIEGDENSTDAGEGKPITYDDICKELFLDKKTYWLGNKKTNYLYSDEYNYNDLNNCTNLAQAKHVAAFIKLQNIAKYLNKGWKPKFGNKTKNWQINYYNGEYFPKYISLFDDAVVCFSSKKAALEAIRIMGKESLYDLFNKDW